MGKSRMMGAGHASATLYKCDPNLSTVEVIRNKVLLRE